MNAISPSIQPTSKTNNHIACGGVPKVRYSGNLENQGPLIWELNKKLTKNGLARIVDDGNWLPVTSATGLRYNVQTKKWSGLVNQKESSRKEIDLNSLGLTAEEKQLFKTMENIAEKSALKVSSNQTISLFGAKKDGNGGWTGYYEEGMSGWINFMVEGRQIASSNKLPEDGVKIKINGIDFEVKTEIFRDGCGVEKLINQKPTEVGLFG